MEDEITWRVSDESFFWDITLPETGTKTFSTKCKYCDKVLKLNIDGLDQMTSQMKFYKKSRIIGAILATFFVLIFILGFSTRLGAHSVFQFFMIVAGIGFIISLLTIIAMCVLIRDPGPGYDETGILAELQLSPTDGPHDCHYVASVDIIE